MATAWYDRDRSVFDREKREVQAEYPNLHFYRDDNRMIVRGGFPLRHDGKDLDRFQIEIELPRKRKDDIPVIRETAGRIPRSNDNHVNELTGDICLFVPEERWRIFPVGSTLLAFLNGPVRNYFLGIALKELGEPWPFGERPHGRAGIIEFYSELIGISDPEVIERYIQCLSKQSFKGHWACPCGSGNKIRNCHASEILELKEKVPWYYARKSLEQLRL